MDIYLVGGFNPSEKYEFVSWDYDSQYMEKNTNQYIYIYSQYCWFTLLITGTLWLFNIAMENGPFIDGLPIKKCDCPWLC